MNLLRNGLTVLSLNCHKIVKCQSSNFLCCPINSPNVQVITFTTPANMNMWEDGTTEVLVFLLQKNVLMSCQLTSLLIINHNIINSELQINYIESHFIFCVLLKCPGGLVVGPGLMPPVFLLPYVMSGRIWVHAHHCWIPGIEMGFLAKYTPCRLQTRCHFSSTCVPMCMCVHMSWSLSYVGY